MNIKKSTYTVVLRGRVPIEVRFTEYDQRLGVMYTDLDPMRIEVWEGMIGKDKFNWAIELSEGAILELEGIWVKDAFRVRKITHEKPF